MVTECCEVCGKGTMSDAVKQQLLRDLKAAEARATAAEQAAEEERLCRAVSNQQRDDAKANLAAAEQREALLRKMLWCEHWRHGGHQPYGDDGEWQCCGIDFKRWSPELILAALQRARETGAKS